MINYLLRRVVYGILILLGVNLITFVLFFAVNTPDDMARLNLGGRRVTADAIEAWKAARGLDKPLFINTAAEGVQKITDTVFFERSVPLLFFDFGRSDSGRDIGYEISTRMWPSLALAVPTFLLGLIVMVAWSLLVVLFRRTRVEAAAIGLSVFSDVHFLALLHHCGPVALFKADAAFPHFRMGGRLGMHGILGAAGADCALFAFGQRYAPLSSDVSRGNRPRLCSYGTRQGVI